MASNFPTSPTLNQTYSADNKTWVWNGSAWGLSLVAGTLPVTSGGTGQTSYTNGQLLIGNTTGNTLTKATLTQGSGITITNGAGAITIAASAPTPAGSTTQVQYNSAGALAGSANLVFDGTTLTANDLIDSSLTASKPVFTNASKNLVSTGTLGTDQGGTGLTSFTSGGAVYASSTSALTTGVLPVASGGTGTASPGLVQGTNVTISGTWPNQTISASGGSSVSAATPSVLGTVYGFYNATGNSVGFGIGSLNANASTGAGNTGVGYQTLYNNVSNNNTAIGFQALYTSAGVANTSGMKNTAIGYQAGYATTTGSFNVFIGHEAAKDSVGAVTENVIIGLGTGRYTTGNLNVIIGSQSAIASTFSGGTNVVIGADAGTSLTSGGTNVFIGYQAGKGATTGGSNVAIGHYAGNGALTGTGNVLVGRYAGYQITSGSNNVILGGQFGGYSSTYNIDTRTTNNNVVITNGEGAPVMSWNTNRFGVIHGILQDRLTKNMASLNGTFNWDLLTYSGTGIIWFTGSGGASGATGNWTINVRGSSSVTYQSQTWQQGGNPAVGGVTTLVVMVTQLSTPYYCTTFQIDGTTQTVKWQGGVAPSAGNANSIDMYVYTIHRLGDGYGYDVFGSLTKFA